MKQYLVHDHFKIDENFKCKFGKVIDLQRGRHNIWRLKQDLVNKFPEVMEGGLAGVIGNFSDLSYWHSTTNKRPGFDHVI